MHIVFEKGLGKDLLQPGCAGATRSYFQAHIFRLALAFQNWMYNQTLWEADRRFLTSVRKVIRMMKLGTTSQ